VEETGWARATGWGGICVGTGIRVRERYPVIRNMVWERVSGWGRETDWGARRFGVGRLFRRGRPFGGGRRVKGIRLFMVGDGLGRETGWGTETV